MDGGGSSRTFSVLVIVALEADTLPFVCTIDYIHSFCTYDRSRVIKQVSQTTSQRPSLKHLSNLHQRPFDSLCGRGLIRLLLLHLLLTTLLNLLMIPLKRKR